MTLPDWLQPLADLVDDIPAHRIERRFPTVPDDARPAAVLILFADGTAGPELLLTERASTLRNHAGQISFPGGSTDPEDGEGPDAAVRTALREAREEVGIEAETVEVFGVLPTVWLPPSNFAVTPVLGYWRERHAVSPMSPDEVEGILHQPIAQLVDPANRFTVVHPIGWKGPGFDVGTQVPLWGFTAMLIDRLLAEVGWEQPWNADDERPVPEFR